MPRVQLPGGELRDEIRQRLYDTIDIANAEAPAGTRSFFSNVQAKPRSQTNLRQNNILEAMVSFRTLGITLDAQNIYALNRGVLPLLMEHSSFIFRVGEKIYQEANGTHVAGRLVGRDALAGGTDAAQVYQHYSKEAVAGIALGAKHSVDIPPLQSFRVDWAVEGLSAAETVSATPAAGAGTKARFILSLLGLLRRPVQ